MVKEIETGGTFMYQYIGVTDFASVDQVTEMVDVLEAHNPSHDLMLHAGVMTSRKVVDGVPSDWARVWPKPEEIHKIFQDKRAYNCLHYADFSQHDDQLQSRIIEVAALAGKYVNAIQLDMTWPDPRKVAKARNNWRLMVGEGGVWDAHTREPEIILQVGQGALEQVPRRLADVLSAYPDSVDRVLLDMSGGRGIEMATDRIFVLIEAALQHFCEDQITVAGGLCAATMYHMASVWDRYPHVSIDAQGKLRSSGSAKDPLDMDLVRDYIITACEIHEGIKTKTV